MGVIEWGTERCRTIPDPRSPIAFSSLVNYCSFKFERLAKICRGFSVHQRRRLRVSL
jgi:hypothetical protein